jgi:hypothetical protein
VSAGGYDRITWIADGKIVGSGESIDLSALKKTHKYIRGKLVKTDRLYQGRTLIQPFQFQPRQSNATRIVTLNGFPVNENNLAGQTITTGDQILVTVTAEDGITTRHYKATTVAKTTSPLLPGDVNGDGRVDIIDVSLTLQHVLGFIDLSEKQKTAADVNKDGKIDVLDVTLLKQYTLGLINAFTAAN